MARSRRSRHRRGRSHPSTGNLPPVPKKLKRRIRRGELVELHLLLHANLTRASGTKRGRSRSEAASLRPIAAITDLAGWAEAWSVYAAVLGSFYPHLAPRLFLYQHFIVLKSRSFQPAAWLRYVTPSFVSSWRPTRAGTSRQLTRNSGPPALQLIASARVSPCQSRWRWHASPAGVRLICCSMPPAEAHQLPTSTPHHSPIHWPKTRHTSKDFS